MWWLIWVFSSEYILSINYTYICPAAESNDFFYVMHIRVFSSEYVQLIFFTYICPGAESYDYFCGMHSIGSDEAAHVSLLIWICTVYIFTYICPVAEPNAFSMVRTV